MPKTSVLSALWFMFYAFYIRDTGLLPSPCMVVLKLEELLKLSKKDFFVMTTVLCRISLLYMNLWWQRHFFPYILTSCPSFGCTPLRFSGLNFVILPASFLLPRFVSSLTFLLLDYVQSALYMIIFSLRI